jgi:hypothetical protein
MMSSIRVVDEHLKDKIHLTVSIAQSLSFDEMFKIEKTGLFHQCFLIYGDVFSIYFHLFYNSCQIAVLCGS